MASDRHTFSLTSDGTEYIWNVPDLWAAAEGLQVLTLFVRGFEEAQDVQEWLDHPDLVPEEMARIHSADLAYPIILHPAWFVMDGFHRIGKTLLLGRPTIQVVRFLPDNLPSPSQVRVLPPPVL